MSAFPRRENLGLSRGWICSGPREMSINLLSQGASGARGNTKDSDHLHVLVLRSRNAKELTEKKKKVMTLVSSCTVWFPRPFNHTALGPKLSSFASFEDVNYISTWPWSQVAGTQLTVRWDTEMSSLFLCFCSFSPTRFIKQSPYKI